MWRLYGLNSFLYPVWMSEKTPCILVKYLHPSLQIYSQLPGKYLELACLPSFTYFPIHCLLITIDPLFWAAENACTQLYSRPQSHAVKPILFFTLPRCENTIWYFTLRAGLICNCISLVCIYGWIHARIQKGSLLESFHYLWQQFSLVGVCVCVCCCLWWFLLLFLLVLLLLFVAVVVVALYSLTNKKNRNGAGVNFVPNIFSSYRLDESCEQMMSAEPQFKHEVCVTFGIISCLTHVLIA
jgi:hypothetical protein